MFSSSTCRAKAISSYEVDEKTGAIYTEVLKTDILDCPMTNIATKAIFGGLSLLGQKSVTFNYQIIEDQLHLKSPYVPSQETLNCGDAARVVRVLERL